MEQHVKKLKVSIKTLGCQMNVYDTQVARGLLEHAGYEIMDDGDDGYSERPACRPDIVIMNTCSVREHAEDRVYGRLHELKQVKQQRADLIIGLMGCMPEEHRERLFARFPHLDFMIGSRNTKDLPAVLEEVRRTRAQTARILDDRTYFEYSDLAKRGSGINAWLPIMTGCNKVCTFCVVPKTRGPEVSMPAREVYREACRLVDQGFKQITLLGQNVNSYNGNGGQTDESGDVRVRFPELLQKLNNIEGLERICFTTSHPQDATEDLFQAVRDSRKVSRRFHLPVQSGSSRILKRMRRLHHIEHYEEKAAQLRALVPDVNLTTDIICGFPGEREEDFQATCALLERIRFGDAYIFKYSPRPATPAYKLPDDVPPQTKEGRNRALLDLQRSISRSIREAQVGETVSVLVEGRSAKRSDELLGRTDQEQKVVFPGAQSLIGTRRSVRIGGLAGETLLGRLEVENLCAS